MATVALVTGANKGIGREVVTRLTAEGMTVFLGARDVERGQAAATELGVYFVQLDVGDEASVKAALAAIEQQCGVLDVLVNNAGIANDYGDILNANLDKCKQAFDTNVFGPVRVLQAANNLLRKSSAPRIVNVSSELGSLTNNGDPNFEFADTKPLAYNASKAALNMVTVLANHAFAAVPNAKVNSACPGYTSTEINGNTGYRTVQQAADIIVKLATLPNDGPTGAFFNDAGPIPW